MNFKWAIGAAAALLAVTLVLPGSAFAGNRKDKSYIKPTTSTVCDGTFSIELDFYGGRNGGDAYVEIEGNSYAEVDPPAGMTATGSDHPEFVDGVSPNEWDFEPGFQDNFFTLSGDYDSVDALPDGAVDVDYRVEWNGNNDVMSSGGVSVTSGLDGSWSECVENYCVDGANGVEQLSFQSTATNDCDPVRICLDGQSMTVTEFVADNLEEDFTRGSCVPTEDPPPPPPATEEEPEELVEEEEEAVAEVSPVVEEVAALPAAGYGTTDASGITWVAVLGLALIGIGGGGTILITRRS